MLSELGRVIWRSLRGAAPLLNLRVFGSRVYAAAETSVFFIGAAQFGGMIILPLYFELLRGKGAVATGLLLLAYGAGAAIVMRSGGRLTDRFGGGITTVAGLIVTVATTIPFVFLGGHASLLIVEFLLFLRGTGLGLSGLAAMSAADRGTARRLPPTSTTPDPEAPPRGGGLRPGGWRRAAEGAAGCSARWAWTPPGPPPLPRPQRSHSRSGRSAGQSAYRRAE